MTHWSFVAAAYGVAIGATLGLLLWTVAALRKAEAAVEAVKRR